MANVQSAYSVLLHALPGDVAASLAAGKAVPASMLPTAAPSLSPADSARVQSAVSVVLSALPGSAASSLVANYGNGRALFGSTATIVATATDSVISAATVVNQGSTVITGDQTSTPPAATNTQPGGTITNSPSSTHTGPAALATGGTGVDGGPLQGGQVAGVAVGIAAAGVFLIALALFFWRRRSKNAAGAGGRRKSSDKAFPEVAWLYDSKREPSNGSGNAPEVHAPLMTQANTAYQPHPISGPGTPWQPTPVMSGAATPNHVHPAATAATTRGPSSISSWRPGTNRSLDQRYRPLNQPYSTPSQNYGTTTSTHAPGAARTLTASSKGAYTFIPPIPTLSSAPESDHSDLEHTDDEDEDDSHDGPSHILFSSTSGPFLQPFLPIPNFGNPFSDPTSLSPEQAPQSQSQSQSQGQYEYSVATIGRVVSLENRQPLMTIGEEGRNPYNTTSTRQWGGVGGAGVLRGVRSELGGTEVDRAELSAERSSSNGLGASSASGTGSSPGQESAGEHHGNAGGNGREERGEVMGVERNGSYGLGNASLSHPEANLSPVSGRSLRF